MAKGNCNIVIASTTYVYVHCVHTRFATGHCEILISDRTVIIITIIYYTHSRLHTYLLIAVKHRLFSNRSVIAPKSVGRGHWHNSHFKNGFHTILNIFIFLHFILDVTFFLSLIVCVRTARLYAIFVAWMKTINRSPAFLLAASIFVWTLYSVMWTRTSENVCGHLWMCVMPPTPFSPQLFDCMLFIQKRMIFWTSSRFLCSRFARQCVDTTNA